MYNCFNSYNTTLAKRIKLNDIGEECPIHADLLKYPDKQFILRNSATKLKDNPYECAKIFISDVSKDVREERMKLKEWHLDGICSREEVEYAFVPWNILARILHKVKDTVKLKSFFLPASENSDFD